MYAVLRVVVICFILAHCLFFFVHTKILNNVIPFTKRTILLKLLLIKRKSKALMKIYVPTLECKNDPFPSDPHKHCQKTPSQNILCSLKLPSGPPQIHFSANPAGLLYVFLSCISPQGILHWALLKVFLMSYNDTTVGHLWLKEIEESRKEERWTWRKRREIEVKHNELNRCKNKTR